jgi:hypothetical protein
VKFRRFVAWALALGLASPATAWAQSRPLSVYAYQGSTIRTGQVAVDSAGADCITAAAGVTCTGGVSQASPTITPRKVTIVNGGTAMFCGTSAVAANSGVSVGANATISFEAAARSTIYCITAAGSTTAYVLIEAD